jgi:3,4-dihydroxy-2-butanone 4-phosphate synthase
VLIRSGHTEAAVDLCKLANLPPVAVICELANDDGTIMVGAQIEAFADKHKLKRISVADLIAYRQSREKLVERVAAFPVKTAIGELAGYAYRTPFEPVLHFAFVLRRSCRRSRGAGAASQGEHHRRYFRRRSHRSGSEAFQGGGARRARLPSRRLGWRPGQSIRHGGAGFRPRAGPTNGARSGLERRSCATWESIQSGFELIPHANTLASMASASRSHRSTLLMAEAEHKRRLSKPAAISRPAHRRLSCLVARSATSLLQPTEWN